MDGNTPTTASTERRVRRTLADEIVNLKGELQAAHAKAAADIAALQKKVESVESSQKWAIERAAKAEAALEQINQVLDVLDGAPPRKKPHPNGYGELELDPITRLSAYLAQRK